MEGERGNVGRSFNPGEINPLGNIRTTDMGLDSLGSSSFSFVVFVTNGSRFCCCSHNFFDLVL